MVLRWISYLPLFVLYWGSNLIYLISFYIIRYRYQVVLENMTNAFPEKQPEEVKKLVKQFYKNFGDFMVESLKSITISEQELKKRVLIRDPEVIERYLDKGQSVLVLTGHIFNWEWLLLASSLRIDNPHCPIYKKLSNSYFDKIMLSIRSRFGCTPIEMQETISGILRRRNTASAYGLVADQTPLADADIYWHTFLNQDTAFFRGTERIAYLTKYPVLFMGMKRLKRGYYEIRYEEIAEPPYGKHDHCILDRYIEKLEKQIKERPAEWLWSHRRWKHKKPENPV